MKYIHCIMALFCLTAIDAGAQLLNQSQVFISNGAVIYTEHEVINRGLFFNQGELILTSHWRNTGTYQGNGLFRITGTSALNFFHDGDPVNTIIVNNASAIVQGGKVPVTAGISFISGRWRTSDSDTLLIGPAATVSGGSPQSYVIGPMHHRGTGIRFFPIGAATDYLPLWLENVSGIDPQIRGEVFNNVTVPAIVSPVSYTDHYWQIDAYQNTFTGSPVTVGLPVNSLRQAYIGLLYSPDLTNFAFVPSSLLENTGYWLVSSDAAVQPGYIAIGERPSAAGDDTAFYFPNTLSPEAQDPENRSVRVYGSLVPDGFSFVVFSRTGTRIFETGDLAIMQSAGWSGLTDGGKELAPGSYPYYLKARTSLGEIIEQKGIISIVR